MSNHRSVVVDGRSSTGNFTEAVEDAVQRAKEQLTSDTVEWQLAKVGGLYGGFVGVRELTVSITARTPSTDAGFRTNEPHIDSLDPSQVTQGFEGQMSVNGTAFRNDDFVMIDGHVPATEFVSSTLLRTQLTSDITATPGTKSVKVHSADGALSNEQTLTVVGR